MKITFLFKELRYLCGTLPGTVRNCILIIRGDMYATIYKPNNRPFYENGERGSRLCKNNI